MAIKDRIKEARQMKHLTQEQLSSKIGIAKSTLAGYETGIREPSIEMMGKIMFALDVDANYLWQDETDFPIQVSYDEMKHIEKYRDLDDHGKDMVDVVLNKEWERSTTEKEQQQQRPAPISIIRESKPDYLQPNAAHDIEGASEEAKAYVDALMDDDSVWEK